MATRARIRLRKRPEFLGVLALRDFRFFLASAAFADVGIAFRMVVTGWVVLELEGDADEIERSIAWAEGLGVRVDSTIGDVVEGG